MSSSCSEEAKKAEEKKEHAALEPENVSCEIAAGGVGGECLENINTSPTATTTACTTCTTRSRVEPEEDCNDEFSIDVCDDTGDEAGRKGADGAHIALAGGAGALEAQVLSFTCFTGTNVQILTLQGAQASGFARCASTAAARSLEAQVLSLLALLVQTYKYWLFFGSVRCSCHSTHVMLVSAYICLIYMRILRVVWCVRLRCSV